jgi:hypothetical protein
VGEGRARGAEVGLRVELQHPTEGFAVGDVPEVPDAVAELAIREGVCDRLGYFEAAQAKQD